MNFRKQVQNAAQPLTGRYLKATDGEVVRRAQVAVRVVWHHDNQIPPVKSLRPSAACSMIL